MKGNAQLHLEDKNVVKTILTGDTSLLGVGCVNKVLFVSMPDQKNKKRDLSCDHRSKATTVSYPQYLKCHAYAYR